MKLYNLFESIILEERLLTEGVSDDAVIDAINGKYYVNLYYDDFPDDEISHPPSKRYTQVYCFGETKRGNKAIRAFQPFGQTKTEIPRWKIFRLDRIRGWEPTKAKFYTPVKKFNPNGDKSFRKVFAIAKFDEKYNKTNYQRKSVDITPDVVANMSPEKLAKYQASIQKSAEKNKVQRKPKPEPQIDTNNPSQSEPVIAPDLNKDEPSKPAYIVPQNDNKPENMDGETTTDIPDEKEDLKKRLQTKLQNKNKLNKDKNGDDTTTSRP
jgi:hypothetical protein